jgi:glycosyltransferase involved in cell wall biosynthesis
MVARGAAETKSGARMKIGFDVSQTAEAKAGCGYLADQLIRALVRLAPADEFLLYPTFYGYRYRHSHLATRPPGGNVRTHFGGFSWQDQVRGWDMAMADRTEWLGSPDVVHSNNFSCVRDHRSRLVYTLYDLAPIRHPDFTTESNRLICFEGLFRASVLADRLLAISEFTRREFLEIFPHYPADRIDVMHLGTRPELRRIEDSRRLSALIEPLGLAPGFWLGVGTIEPRKNYRLLVEAYTRLDNPPPLVIAGGKGWLESDLGVWVREKGLSSRVRFTGYVTDEELAALYTACLGFVYPSRYEGFGLPVLEAMACGAPVITSNASSLPEVGGDAVLYHDPLSAEELTARMVALAADPSLRERLSRAGRERAGLFSWDRAAKVSLEAYRKALDEAPWFPPEGER